jgi:hypothetical protein
LSFLLKQKNSMIHVNQSFHKKENCKPVTIWWCTCKKN